MAATATRSRAAFATDPPATARSAQRLFEPRGGELTLEDAILGIWEDLIADGSAGCLVCGERVAAGAGCGICGSELL